MHSRGSRSRVRRGSSDIPSSSHSHGSTDASEHMHQMSEHVDTHFSSQGQGQDSEQFGGGHHHSGLGVYKTKKNLWDFTDSSASEAVREEILSRVDDFWPTFQDIPADIKNAAYQRFLKRYQWHPDMSQPQHVRKAFNRLASIKYRDFTYGMHNRGRKHAACPDEVYEKFLAYWETDAFKVLSGRNKANRAENPRLHTGGSKSWSDYRTQMAEETHAEPSSWDVYCRIHKVAGADGSYSWVDESSSKFSDTYEAERAHIRETYNIEEIPREMDEEIYDRVCASMSRRKDRAPYLGNTPGKSVPRHVSSSSYQNVPDLASRMAEIESKHKQDMEALQQQMLAQQQQMLAQQQQMQDYYAQMQQMRAGGQHWRDWRENAPEDSDEGDE